MISRFRYLVLCATLPVAACTGPQQDACTDLARVGELPEQLSEASGLAASRRTPGLLWSHNDSEGMPMLYAIDESGALIAEIALPGAGAQFDWEDIATGPCPSGDCIFIGDIGDNLHQRDDRAILRIAEPDPRDPGHVNVERFPIRLPHGPEDAEAMFVDAAGTVHVITKGRRQPPMLYRYPPPLRSGERVTLEEVQQLDSAIAQLPDMVTGADMSSDGRRVAVRTYSSLRLHRFDGDTLIPMLRAPFDLAGIAEPQGEGVAFSGDALLLASEAGPGGTRAILSRVHCSRGGTDGAP